MMLPDYPCFSGRVGTLSCGPPESEAIEGLTEREATNVRQDTGPKSGNGPRGWDGMMISLAVIVVALVTLRLSQSCSARRYWKA